MSINKIPILIPVKTTSVRCPRKNFILLNHTLDWINKQGLFENTIVICDSKEIKDYAISLEVNVFDEITPCEGDNKAASDCAVELGIDSYFILPVTQPLRSDNLLDDMISVFGGKNLVVSAQYVADRTIFHFDDKGFITPSKERKGCMCKEHLMVDGAAYLVRTEWAKNVKTNEDFWNEPFGYAINHMPFLDIDTDEDMEKFKTLLQLWSPKQKQSVQ